MKTLPVAEVRSHFSSLLKEVESGHEIGICFGRQKSMIAVIVPFARYKKKKVKRLGTLEGKARLEFKGAWSISDEDLLSS